MRWMVTAVMLALMVPLLGMPQAAAQDGAWMTDGRDDYQFNTDNGPVPIIRDRFGILDLLEFRFEETDAFLIAQWTVSDLEGHEPGNIVDQIFHAFHFNYGELAYGVEYGRFYNDGTVPGLVATNSYEEVAWVGTYSGSGFLSRSTELVPDVDISAGTISIQIPREIIRDQDGAPLLRDRQLTNFWMETGAPVADLANIVGELAEQEGDLVHTGDRMPDTDFGPAWTLSEGAAQSGHIWLASERPFRASNGEATTFLFEIDVHNSADLTDTISLVAQDVPGQWTITMPQNELRIDGAETTTVPVLATVPFRHEHGLTESFTIASESRYDPTARGFTTLGVHYMDPAQPAGHHDTLYLHDAGQSCNAFMNTMQEDPSDTGEPIDGCFTGGGLTDSRFEYRFVLGPALRMGLDFDTARTGALSFAVQSPLPYPGARMDATLYHIAYEEEEVFPGFFLFRGEWTPIATAIQESAESGPGATASIDMVLEPTPESDYIAYQDNSEMVLEVIYTMDVSAFALLYPGVVLSSQMSPDILPGGVMQLPLNEFHDDVNEFFSAASGVDLVPRTDQQRLVNPGKTVVFRVDAENFGDSDGVFDLEIVGANVDWADVLGDMRIRLKAGESRELAVAVTPPNSAQDGDLVDLTLHASKTDNPNVRSLIRLLAEVDTEIDHDDEALDAAATDASLQSKGAPAPFGLLLAGLLVAFTASRRNHNR